jgi:glycosyltransferase involved in cell wall biosynthesis
MVSALEKAGHSCTIYLLDNHGWHIDQHRHRIRQWWPGLTAEIRSFDDSLIDGQAIFATSWDTAYAVLGSSARGLRCYLVQDFEPAFSPAGSEYLLAEATYSFGFVGVTAGRWLAERLRRDYGMLTRSFDFGCDLDRYSLDPGRDTEREGIAYYCRPATPRRAHELAVLALSLFSQSHTDTEIHLFGEAGVRTPFRATSHGVMNPAELSALYNRCAAGLVLSATNVSLVPQEMLASGCVPVVNDAEHNRVVLGRADVVYAPATPYGLADALSRLADSPPEAKRARAARAAASVTATSWAAAERDFVQIVEDEVAAHLLKIRQA